MLYLDSETYSETPIKNGTYVYTADCEVMLVTWAIDDGPTQCWDVTEAPCMPAELKVALHDRLICAHNSMFDRNALKHGLGVDIPIERWRDTMVKAYLHGLPGSLDLLCDILKVSADKAKIKDGKKLIQLFCKPQPFKFPRSRKDFPTKGAYDAAKAEAMRTWTGRATRLTHPVEWARFKEYAMADIDAMREVDRKLPKWNYQAGAVELANWHLDQKINDRGIYVDTALATAAIVAVGDRKLELGEETLDSTDGELGSTMKREPMLEYVLRSYGVSLPDLQKSTLQRRIDDPDLPDALKELLRIRLQAGSTAASKYKSLLKAVNSDSRLRGTKQFAGAFRTARWAGRTFQPDNLPRPTLPDEDIDFGIEMLLLGGADLIVPDIMALTSSAIRKCISAPPGKKLVIADLANIEGRMLAWLAGEEWKLQAFRDYDAGAGADLYKLAYARAFNIPTDAVDKAGRQIGKVMELMLGYAGGVGAFVTGAATYHVDLDAMSKRARPSIPDDVWEDATGFYDWLNKVKGDTLGLSHEVFCVCDSLKRMWRRAHPMIVELWREVEDLTRAAILKPGKTFKYRGLKFRRDGAWLRIVLPSGRALCYPSPQVSSENAISYMGMNQYTKKWERITTYSGKLVENITQAAARDVLVSSMQGVEDNGYEIVLHVHDELVTEAPDTDEYSHTELELLMTINPAWAEGLPLAAAGFEAQRYRKD